MRRDPRAYLWDIEHYGGLAYGWGMSLSAAEYDSNIQVRLAIERALQNCGEAVVQLARCAPDVAARLPDYQRVIAFRNVLVHGYDELGTGQILKIIQGDLPVLIACASSLLTEMGRL